MFANQFEIDNVSFQWLRWMQDSAPALQLQSTMYC